MSSNKQIVDESTTYAEASGVGAKALQERQTKFVTDRGRPVSRYSGSYYESITTKGNFHGTAGLIPFLAADGYEAKGETALKWDETNDELEIDGDIIFADSHKIEVDEIKARDSDGLLLTDDGTTGIKIEDGGNVLAHRSMKIGDTGDPGDNNLEVVGKIIVPTIEAAGAAGITLDDSGGSTMLKAEDTGLTVGAGGAGVDYSMTFDGETNDGVLTWMEDEDYFKFDDNIFMDSDRGVYFRTTDALINCPTNGGQMRIYASQLIKIYTDYAYIGNNGGDVTLTFDGGDNDGVLMWMEDEDYFKFNDDVVINDGEDIYTVAWQSYSPALTGWSGVPGTIEVYYKKVGNLVFMAYNISGTSDDVTVQMGVPYTAVNEKRQNLTPGYGEDNGAALADNTRVYIDENTSTVIIEKDATGAVWTGSGTKRVYGQFWYEAA